MVCITKSTVQKYRSVVSEDFFSLILHFAVQRAFPHFLFLRNNAKYCLSPNKMLFAKIFQSYSTQLPEYVKKR